MSKDEINTLKNELYKEIKDVENKINQKLLKKFEKDEENISEYIEKFNKMFKRGESLLESMSSQIINFDKINELENFRNKMDSMMISHEIRINNNIKDIQNIKFKYDREITENLTVPGFVGPSCKYKTISNYISSNIDEISKMKIENEVYKKDNKDLRKKVDDIIKTCLNLVDNTNVKFLNYVDRKTKHLEESLNTKLGEFSDKIIDLKSLIMTQKNAKEIQATLMEELQNNNYTKTEIDDKITDILNNFETNIKDINIKFSNDNILIKISVEKIEKEIIEIKKNIKEIKNKIKQTIQNQQEIMRRNNLLMKTMKYNASEKSLNVNSIQNTNTNLKISSPRKKINEEEKQSKFKNSPLKEKNRTIDSMEVKGKKSIQHHMTDIKLIKELKDIIKLNSINADSSQNKIIENSPKTISRNSKFLSSSSTQNEKEKFKTNLSNINSEEVKDTISDNENENDNDNDLNIYIYPNNISDNKNDTIEKDENDNNIISTPDKAKIQSLMNYNINKTENINKRSICLLKKLNKNKNDIISNLKLQNNNTNKNNISDLLSFGLSQNQKSIILPVDGDKSSVSNNPIVQVMSEDFIKEKIDYLNNKSNNNNFINNKIIQKEKRNSIHKLAAIDYEEKANTLLPNVGEFSSRSSKGKYNKNIAPLIKNIFQHSYQMNKTYKNLSDDFPVKIKAAFGRTGYTLYDKKEEGINYLIKKGIENKMRRHKSHSTVVNFKLCPAAKIKVYSNL